jgi:hypothetical protein
MAGFLFEGEVILDRSQFEGASVRTAFSAFATDTAIADVHLGLCGYILFASLRSATLYQNQHQVMH